MLFCERKSCEIVSKRNVTSTMFISESVQAGEVITVVEVSITKVLV